VTIDGELHVDVEAWATGSKSIRDAITRQVDAALADVGFLILHDHGIDGNLFDDARAAAYRFFEAPASDKERMRVAPEAYRGWVGPGTETNAATFGLTTPPDLKESYVVGPTTRPPEREAGDGIDWYAANRFPPDPAFEASWLSLYRAAEALSFELLSLLADALGVPAAAFADASRQHTSSLAANWYPPTTGTRLPDQYRIGPHTDFGTLTLLDRDPQARGLEVQVRDGSWVELPNEPGTLVMNTADMMARWSGDRWRSARHRIRVPEPGDTGDHLSLVFFFEPDPDAAIAPLTGTDTGTESVIWHEYFAAKLSDLTA
jgi:isopenicillin N synthase-like dioxygenase